MQCPIPGPLSASASVVFRSGVLWGSRFLGRSLKHPRPPASAPWSLRLCLLSLPALPGRRCPFGLSGPLGRGCPCCPACPQQGQAPGGPRPACCLFPPSLPACLTTGLDESNSLSGWDLPRPAGQREGFPCRSSQAPSAAGLGAEVRGCSERGRGPGLGAQAR